jgi:hypothetical protein
MSAGTNTYDSEWIVLDQNDWTNLGSHEIECPDVVGCMDENACNFNSLALGDDGSCLYLDCAGECGGSSVVDGCGECGGDGTACSVNVTFSVDMSVEGASGDISMRIATVDGEYSPSDWFVMDDSDGDMIYTYTMQLVSGITYG